MCCLSSSSYSQWRDLPIIIGNGCLNQSSLSSPRLPLQTKRKLSLTHGCGSEEKERKFSRNLRGTRTRKFFLTLTLALAITHSLSHILLLYLFTHLLLSSQNCILWIFIYLAAPLHHSLYNPNLSNIPNLRIPNDSSTQFLHVSTFFQSAMMRYEAEQGHIV